MQKFLFTFGLLLICCSLCLSNNIENANKTIRVIYSNDLYGYIVPCGCGGRNGGGLARRSLVIQNLIKENPSYLIVDSGNIVDREDKLDPIFEILNYMKYSAVGIGRMDIDRGQKYSEIAVKNKITVLDSSPIPQKDSKPFVTYEINGIKIGVVSFGKLKGSLKSDDMDVIKSRYAAFKNARKDCDILVVLDQAGIVDEKWLEKHEKTLGEPDIVVGGINNIGLECEVLINKTVVVPTSLQGKSIGYVDFILKDKKIIDYKASTVFIEESLPEDPLVKKIVDKYINMPPKPENSVHKGL